MTIKKVNVIGAGPAGLVVAIALHRHRIPVTVFEKGRDVGQRLSGDFQGFESWSSNTDITKILKAIGIETNFLCEPCHSSLLFVRGLGPVTVRSDKHIFYLARGVPMAGTQDTGLKDQALALGAEIRSGINGDQTEGPAKAASGPRRADFIAAGITFKTTVEATARVVLDNDLAPGGICLPPGEHRGPSPRPSTPAGQNLIFHFARKIFTNRAQN